MTIREHITASPGGDPSAAPDVAALLERFAQSGRTIAREVRRAALSGRLGYAGAENVTGDRQKKLDVVGNEVVLGDFRRDPLVAGVISEEDDRMVPTTHPSAPYVVCCDPIDGSSNTDIDGPLGTIFSICRRDSAVPLPRGRDILAAGYILYGPSTLFVCATGGGGAGEGVAGWTLDDESGAYVLTHPSIRCPRRGKTFSANLGRQREWHPHLRSYLDHLTESDKATGRPYSLRYIGALVADLHRCLIEGGIYFYPPDPKNRHGKLRLLYECAPLAFLTERAGGRASDGERRILEIEAAETHQRSPLAIGSADDVALYESFVRTGKPS
jgi:fructose-1,6-bisphosphatase I